ncbi:YhcN/YlaJ family sporulation lipoprotein [Rossellomorea aquimaris]|uniref:YhcN/YlaJ family sporulation lipoprotein n=1 Tax=Rossellomorea aquimaris TaxID=189382 RepID=UPI001CD7C9E0|nr:YhcN/YlaJ family sporulation lipoprotein [Rossellomorea aquimaris]MCA1053935.1 YhcN/YlaJ family sporulation lipoprotein [Rossellomorea aquimaris]
MKKYLIVSLMGVMISGIATGCGTADNDNMNEQGMNTKYDNGALERVGYNRDRTDNYMNMNDTGTRDSVRENYSLSEEAANNVADLKEVSKAYVLTTPRNAYVAAVMENGKNGDISQQLEDKIAKQVRKADAGLDNVYVSTNPDFIERMRGYADKAENGKPLKGLGEELSTTIKRVFPDQE